MNEKLPKNIFGKLITPFSLPEIPSFQKNFDSRIASMTAQPKVFQNIGGLNKSLTPHLELTKNIASIIKSTNIFSDHKLRVEGLHDIIKTNFSIFSQNSTFREMEELNKTLSSIINPNFEWMKNITSSLRPINIEEMGILEKPHQIYRLDILQSFFKNDSFSILRTQPFNNMLISKELVKLFNSQKINVSEVFSSLDEELKEQIEENFIEVDDSIKDELSSKIHFDFLSKKAKKAFMAILFFVFLLIHDVFYDYVKEEVSKVIFHSKNISSPPQAKNLTRKNRGGLDRNLLKDYRVTIPKSLNIRFKPSIKSKIITVLQPGTLVYVIDKSNRSWLFVEIDIDGNLIQGWVARRYTAYFR